MIKNDVKKIVMRRMIVQYLKIFNQVLRRFIGLSRFEVYLQYRAIKEFKKNIKIQKYARNIP